MAQYATSPAGSFGDQRYEGRIERRTESSVLDGWWAEAYDGKNGFAVGSGDTHVLTDVHDRVDAESLYSVLEEQVIPLFYQRDQTDCRSPGSRE